MRRGKRNPVPDYPYQLEELVDKRGLSAVLAMLEEICNHQSGGARVRVADTNGTRHLEVVWRRAGRRVYAAEVAVRKIPGLPHSAGS